MKQENHKAEAKSTASKTNAPESQAGCLLGSLVVVIYFFSFFLPAGVFATVFSGWGAFSETFQTFLALFPEIASSSFRCLIPLRMWIPNPLLWLGVYGLFVGRNYLATVTGGAALVLAIYAISEWKTFIGAHVWAASMVVLFFAGISLSIRDYLLWKKRESPKLPRTN